MSNKFTLGFSPCPNDTFIFDALVHQFIDTCNYQFDFVLEDVQTLNEWALKGKLDITKLSYGVLPKVVNQYNLLDAGSALGKGVGPLLITMDERMTKENVSAQTIAIPGENTTAHLLFSSAYPTANKKIFLRYDEIEAFVAEGKGLGVIIHENRFTYKDRGFFKIEDLGDYWEKTTGQPIPLGGIVIKNNLPLQVQQDVDVLIKKSIEYSFAQYPVLSDFIKSNAQEMTEDVMRQHIDLYVNDYSLSLGEAGRQAILQLMKAAAVGDFSQNIFVGS